MSNDIIVGAATSRDWIDIWSFVFLVLSAVILGLYTWYTRRLVISTQAALEHAQKSSVKVLEQTSRSNEAIETSNKIAERSFELGSRAWLIVNLKTILRDGSFNGYNIEVTNIGKVPATDVGVWYRFDFWDGTEVPDTISPDTDQRPETGFFIGAGMTHIITPRVEFFSPENAVKIRENRMLHTFYCEITYSDVFGKPHKTVTCLQYAEKGHVFDWREWVPAPKHNRPD